MKIRVAIIGGGPAGSASAMGLRAHGIDCVIIEKDVFPRYHIGKSTTGECGNLHPRARSGRRNESPEIPHQAGGGHFRRGAGPNGLSTSPVVTRIGICSSRILGRSGATNSTRCCSIPRSRAAPISSHGQVTAPIVDDDGAVRGLKVRTADGGTIEIQTEMVLDCSGQHTYFANIGVTGPKFVGNYDNQMAIFSRVAGTVRDDTPEATP